MQSKPWIARGITVYCLSLVFRGGSPLSPPYKNTVPSKEPTSFLLLCFLLMSPGSWEWWWQGQFWRFPTYPTEKKKLAFCWVYNVECLVPLVLSFELSHRSGTRGKSPFGRLSRHFMKFKHLAFQHSLFSAWSEKVLTAPSLTQCLSNPAGSPWFTPVLCKYSKSFFFFNSHKHRAL